MESIIVAPVAAPPFSLYIIEAEVLLAKALCSIFAQDPDIKLIGDGRTFDAAAIMDASPDVILFDCDADLIGTQETLTQCRALVPHARVCVLSSQTRPEAMRRALSAGADGYVVKDITPADLLASIKRVRNDGFYADPRLASILLKKNSMRRYTVELSARELDVARLIAQGLSNREISERLILSDKTVKNHVSNIFSKLNVTARTQVAIYVLRNGLA
jgi:DNA-binding NarL/FixJ family response regulator